MVEAAPAARSKGAAVAQDQGDQNNFHIIHAFFRDRFNNYFKSLPMAKYLIIEESLVAVIKFLLSPLDENLQIRGFATLQDISVSSGQDG